MKTLMSGILVFQFAFGGEYVLSRDTVVLDSVSVQDMSQTLFDGTDTYVCGKKGEYIDKIRCWGNLRGCYSFCVTGFFAETARVDLYKEDSTRSSFSFSKNQPGQTLNNYDHFDQWTDFSSQKVAWVRVRLRHEATMNLTCCTGGLGGTITADSVMLRIMANTPEFGNPRAKIDENRDWIYTPVFADPDSDSVSVSILFKPSWAYIVDTAKGKIFGRPGRGDPDTLVGYRACDPDTCIDTALGVTVNHPPVLASDTLVECGQGAFVNYTMQGTDPNGDSVSFRILSKPSWLNLTDASLVGLAPSRDGRDSVVVAFSDSTLSDTFVIVFQVGSTSLGRDAAVFPTSLSLEVFPHPFARGASLRAGVPQGLKEGARLLVFDLHGRMLLERRLNEPGFHCIGSGLMENLGSGLVIARIEAGKNTLSRKVLLIK